MTSTLNVGLPGAPDLTPKIFVIGVGGAGGNAVNNMIASNLTGCEFAVANTDAQAMEQSKAQHRIQLGTSITRGLGAGARPDIGRAAAEESQQEVMELLDGANMVFITAGMGGGTGTGAAPVIARSARDAGILTVGVVTKPFSFEGGNRMRMAEAGIQQLQDYVDTLIVIPNQNLFRVANEKTSFADAFKMADNVLYSGVRGVTDLMINPGMVNLDFNDIRSVMAEMGKAMMGTGEAEGENRAKEAAAAAISNPLLDDVSLQGARGVLINITGGMDITLYEVDEAASKIREQVDPEANIIFGSALDETMEGRMRVSVVATGIDAAQQAERRSYAAEQVVTVKPKPRAVEAASFTPDRVRPTSGSPSAPPPTPTAVPKAEPTRAAANETGADIATLEDDTLIGADEVFIAPRPVNPGPKPQVQPHPSASAPAPMPGPVVGTAYGGMAADEAGDTVPARRSPTIFERITGTHRARREMEQDHEPAPILTQQAPRREMEPAVSQLIDDGTLDIPAFLRRQSN